MEEEKAEKTYLLPGEWKYGKSSRDPVTTYGGAEGVGGGVGDGSIACSGQHGRAQSGLSVLLTSFFLVAQVSGFGVLALPWAVAQTGWAGLGVLVVACVLVGVSAIHLGTSWIILEERWPEYQRACRKPYPSMAYRTLGMAGWHIVNVIQCVTLFGVKTVTIILSAQLVNSIFDPVLPQLGVCSWLLVCGCVVVPLSWLSSPRKFWYASVLALFATVAVVVVVVTKILVDEPATNAQHPAPTIYSFFLGYGTILFSYGGAITFPTIQNDMRDRSQFPLAIIIAFSALLVMYLPLAGLGYHEFGSSIDVNMLMSVSGPTVTTVQVLMLLNNGFTYLMLINPLSQSIEEALNYPTEFGWRRCVATMSLVVLGILVGLIVKDFGLILNFIGSLAVPVLTFILPPIFYIRLCDSKENENWPNRDLSLLHRLLLWLLMTVGATSSFVATWASIQAFLAPSGDNSTCFSLY